MQVCLYYFVGDIDLSSNQILDFLEYFIEEMSKNYIGLFP